MTDNIAPDSSEDNFQIPVSHSQKYKRFIISGALVFFVSRIMSIGYVYVVTRLISDEVMAMMIILAAYQAIMINVVPLGFSYGSMQWTLRDKNGYTGFLKNYYSYSFIVSFPLMTFTTLAMWLSYGFPFLSIDLVLFTCANLLSLFLEILRNTETALYNNDRTILLSGYYSILNSLFVPLFYFFLFQDLTSVLLAWIMALSIVICWELHRALKFISLHVSLSEWKRMFIFSFPVFITTVINIMTVQIDRIFIYGMYDEQSLNTYHWVDVNLNIGLQLVGVFLVGTYSLFVKLRTEDPRRFDNVSRGLFRVIGIISTFIFLGYLVNADFIIPFLLGERFTLGILWMKILSLAFIPASLVSFLLIRFLANEHRVEIIVIRGGGIILRITLALLLSTFQIYGLIMAVMISTTITLVAFIARSSELRNWKKENLIRFSSFFFMGIFISIAVEMLFTWPFTNISLVLLIAISFLLKPLDAQDLDYIERVIPVRMQKFILPILNLLR